MLISDVFPSNYLKASDLQGRDVSVVIDRVDIEKIGTDRKAVLYFQGKQKGMVMNKTNGNMVASLYGQDTDEWGGREIVLFSTWVDYQGKSVEAIRVKPPARKAAPAQQHQSPTRQDPISTGRQPAPLTSDDRPFNDEVPF